MRRLMAAAVAAFFVAGLAVPAEPARAQAAMPAASKAKKKSAAKHRMRGYALWYGGPRFNGRTTAGNQVFDEAGMTAAHRTLPFGTKVRVTNLRNRKSAVVTINDRMARRRTVIIDVTRGAAAELDMLNAGRVPVRLEIVR
ncbi:MAG: septal ring lytic transglycosylase RlpA family protein [Alphaproteobacteria bacterium]|nr:septal ring lytic transglycosylase RlpA family protein [Alphaproteobacteria bacterium]